jgi:hypothetical protein
MSIAKRRLAIPVGLCLALIPIALFVVGTRAGWPKSLQGWQTGLGALAGLLGVAGAALLNAKLARDRDDRLRDLDARTVSIELLAEIASIQAQLRARITLIETGLNLPKERSYILKRLPKITDPVHEKSIGRLGFLDLNLFLALEHFFTLIRFADSNLALAMVRSSVADRLATNINDHVKAAEDSPQKSIASPNATDFQKKLEQQKRLLDSQSKGDDSKGFIELAISGYSEAIGFSSHLVRGLARFARVVDDHPLIKSACEPDTANAGVAPSFHA